MLFLYSGEMAIIIKENKPKIHADQLREILQNNKETGENFYEFLRFQSDESKNTIQTILQYSGSFKGFQDYLSNMIDTEEQWEPDIEAFVYFKFFATYYSSSIGSVSPIYLKYTRVHKHDEMLETVNMNN